VIENLVSRGVPVSVRNSKGLSALDIVVCSSDRDKNSRKFKVDNDYSPNPVVKCSEKL